MTGDRVFALLDVDAMYVSCEQVLQPWLVGKPVVVLSNNDSCVIAQSPQATALGIERGQPWSSLARDPRMRDVVPRSANFEAYGDFTARLLSLLESHTPWVEPYSIDECYLSLPAARASALARRMRQQAHDWLGLPVSIGIGPTRTLAHLATKHAKASGTGVCHLGELDESSRQALLRRTPTEKVWGVAERLAARLARYGITTAADLAAADPGWIRRASSVGLERTVRELRGVPCLPLNPEQPPRRQCMHCRHLGAPVQHRDDLTEIAAAFVATLARRLRRHRRAAGTLTVLATSSPASRGPRHTRQATQTLLPPTAATTPLAAAATALARTLWRPGQLYHRVGVLAGELTAWPAPPTLGEPARDDRDEALAAALDAITARWGTTSIGLGRAGMRTRPGWSPRQEHLWPISPVRWDRLPLVYC